MPASELVFVSSSAAVLQVNVLILGVCQLWSALFGRRLLFRALTLIRAMSVLPTRT